LCGSLDYNAQNRVELNYKRLGKGEEPKQKKTATNERKTKSPDENYKV